MDEEEALRDEIVQPTCLAALRPRRIVIFRALQVGDMLCAVPALRSLRAALPQAHIALVGLGWTESFSRRFCGYVDEFISFPGYGGLPEQPADMEEFPLFIDRVVQSRFDLAIQMHGSGEVTNPLVARFGARFVAGFRKAGSSVEKGFLEYPEGQSEVRRLLRLARFLGGADCGEHLEFPLLGEDWDELAGFEPARRIEQGRYVCLHPGARAAARRWPLENFAAVGRKIYAEMGLPVVVTGSDQEAELTESLVRGLGVPAVNAAGPISIGALAAVLSGARLVVSNDTGVSHVAAGLGLPSVVVFRASDMARWAPDNRSLHRCVWDPEGTRVEAVAAQALALLRSQTRADAG